MTREVIKQTGFYERSNWDLSFYSDEFDLFAHRAPWLTDPTRGYHDLSKSAVEEVLNIVTQFLPFTVIDWGFHDDGSWWFKYKPIWVRLYPSTSNKSFFSVEVVNISAALSYEPLLPVRAQLQDLVRTSAPHLTKMLDVAVLILQVVEIAAGYCEELVHDTYAEHLSWTSNTLANWSKASSHRSGLRPGSIEDTASQHLNITPQQICAMIPSTFRIIAFESVRQQCLTEGWLEFQAELRKRALREKVDSLRLKLHPHHTLQRRNLATLHHDEAVEELVRPKVTFHGTTRSNVISIIEHGFLMPGTDVNGKTIASPRSGMVFRRGIYSSQSPAYALSYSQCHGISPTQPNELPGLRLFVCATLMGRTFSDSWEAHETLRRGYDAHFDTGYEYIVHDRRAMLPCYVIHLDLGCDEAVRAITRIQKQPIYLTYLTQAQQSATQQRHSKLASQQQSPGEKQREAAAKKAAALKWFPFGYGSATGLHFKIEEVAPNDDDEEPQSHLVYKMLVKNHERDFGQIISWTELVEEDEGLLASWFNEPET